MQLLRLFIIPFIALTAVACGGGGDPGPTPLRHHLDDMYIAQVPMEEKREVLETQQGYSMAKMQHAKARADFDEVGTKLDVAKNEQQQAILAEKSAQKKLQRANDSGDMNRVNAAKRELRAEELARKAADEKVAYYKELREYYKKHVRATEEELYHQEARYELSKAKVAKAKNIRPKDFEYARYEEQVQDRSRRSQRATADANREKQKANERRKKWKGLESEAERMRGGQPAANESSSL